MNRRLFKFQNASGWFVKGLLLASDGATHSHVGVVYLPGIVLGSTAVHRLGFDLAQRLVASGHRVCLFDPSRIGESEGNYPAGSHVELAAWVEAGNCVDDTLQVLDFLTARMGIRELVLVGHCGGALTAMYAGARHPAVRGVLLISPPTVTTEQVGDELDRRGVAQIYLSLYARKVLSPRAWLRMLRGESSYRTIFRLLSRLVVQPAEVSATRSFNQRFRLALQAAASDRKQIAIVFGDRDPDVEDFRDFSRHHLPPGAKTRIFPDTSHGFVTEDSQSLLFGEIERFVATVNG